MAGTTAGGVKAVGDPATLFGVCFPNTISVFNGGADANITATTNTRAGGLAFTGVVTSGSGGTNNCLQFSLTVANTDISQQPLRVTAVDLSNGAWIVEAQPSGSPKTMTTSITGLNLTVAGQTNGPVEVNAKPNVVAFSPVNGDITVKRDAVVTLTFNEAIRLVATKVINLRKDENTIGSFDTGDTVLESFTIPTYVNAGTGAPTTDNEYHPTSNETRIQVAGTTLTLRPNLDMDAAATYYLEIPSDAIVDTTSGTALAYAGLNTSGTLTHKFTTVADGASAWTSGPSIYQIESTKADGSEADGSYKVGQAFNVRLKFSSPVSLDGSSTAALKLNVVSGGFTTPNCTLTNSVTLDCPYTVAAGHNSSNTALTYFSANQRNLNVASATALTVTGGTGFKGTGTGTPAASLTLPVYGSYSLGDGKA
ncbi:MAG: Ig-like domain-containing protein, partial [Actinomycetota bacterium]